MPGGLVFNTDSKRTRGASLKLKGKIYSACVRSSMIYGSETWLMKVEDKQRLEGQRG